MTEIECDEATEIANRIRRNLASIFEGPAPRSRQGMQQIFGSMLDQIEAAERLNLEFGEITIGISKRIEL